MKSHTYALVFTVAVLLSLPVAAANITGADLRQQPLTGSLTATIERMARESKSPLWIAWDAPSADPETTMCCFSWGKSKPTNPAMCRLGIESGLSTGSFTDAKGVTHTSDSFTVLVRITDQRPSGLQMFSASCGVEAVDAQVVLLTGVSVDESLRAVEWLIDPLMERRSGSGKQKVSGPVERAIAAIGMHRSPSAISRLEALMRSRRDEKLRAHAAFWLGMRGGASARVTLRQMIDTEVSNHFREQAITGIAQSDDPGTNAFLLDLAKHHPNEDVRAKAIFWIGQRAGEKVADELAAAANDPDDEVREAAVFAISQLPKDKAIPQLIQLARTHRSKVVRERAVFWLGQTRDPRALAFLEEILMQ